MSLLNDYRAKYPIYKEVSDEDLASALHSKYYSDIPYDEFTSKVGIAKEDSFFDYVGDKFVKAITPESKYKSVVDGMDGKVIDSRPAIERKGAPVTDETFNKVKSAYENSTPEKRNELTNRQDWIGNVTSEVDKQYQAVKQDGIGDNRKEAKINNIMQNSKAEYRTAENMVMQGFNENDIATLSKGAPDREVVDYALDTVRSVAKIAPTTGKMVTDFASLGTAYIPVVGDMVMTLGESLDDAIEYQSNKQSPALKDKTIEMQQIIKNGTSVQLIEFLTNNPSVLSDIAIPSIGFTLASGGIGAGVTKVATEKATSKLTAKYAGRNADAIKRLASRYGAEKGTQAAILTNVGVNAGGAFNEAEGDASTKYTAAGIAAIATLAGGKLTKGGAEGVIARGQNVIQGKGLAGSLANKAIAAGKVGASEMTQEYMEGGGQALGVQTGEYAFGDRKNIDLGQVHRQGLLEASAAAPIGAITGAVSQKDRVSNNQRLTISQGNDLADEQTASRLQAEYEAQQKQAKADVAVTNITNPENTVDDAINLANTAIDTSIDADIGLLNSINQAKDAIQADDILEDSNVSNLPNDVPTTLANETTQSASDNLPRGMADLSLQPNGGGVDSVTTTPTSSIGENVPAGTANAGNDAIDTGTTTVPVQPNLDDIQKSEGHLAFIPATKENPVVMEVVARKDGNIGIADVGKAIDSATGNRFTRSQMKDTPENRERFLSSLGVATSSNVDTVNTSQERVDETQNNVQVDQSVEQNKETLQAMLPRLNWAVVGNKRIDDAEGNQIGRTKHVPMDDALEDIRKQGTLSYNGMQNAVNKALKGLPLSKQEKRSVDMLVSHAVANKEAYAPKPEMTAEQEAEYNARLDAEVTGSFDQLFYGEDTQEAKQAVTELSDDDLFEGAGRTLTESEVEAIFNSKGTQNEQTTDNGRTETQTGNNVTNQERIGDSQTAQVNQAEPAGQSQEIRAIVENIIRRRKVANELNKQDAFDSYLAEAKKLLNGDKPNITKLKLAAITFKADQTLFDAFTQLLNLASPQAKADKTAKSNHVETYKQRIADAKSVDELHSIQKEISKDNAISDRQLETLDDLAIDSLDKFTEEKNAADTTTTQRTQQSENNTDLLGDNTATKQAIADAERAKDAKRNSGEDNQNTFTLSGSDSEFEQARAAGAQDLFAPKAEIKPAPKAVLNRKTGYVLVGKDAVAVLNSDNGKVLSVYGLDKVKEADREKVKNELKEIADSTGYAYEETQQNDEVTKAKESTQQAIESIKQDDTIPTADKIKLAADLRNGNVTADDVSAIVGASNTNAPKSNVEDYGVKLEGVRKDMVRAMAKEYSDDEIASLPLSKLWPLTDVDLIENKTAAAIAWTARSMIPSKPRKPYAVKRWVEQVKQLREIGRLVSTAMDMENSPALQKFKEANINHMMDKVGLLDLLERDQWKRIGKVEAYPNAYRYEGKEKVPSPLVRVDIDGNTTSFNASSVADIVDKVNEKLGVQQGDKRMAFEVRSQRGIYFVMKKGDKNYTRLKTFDNSKDAFAFIRDNYDEVLSAWEATKDKLNVKEADIRNKENKPRTGEDYRKGKDVSSEEFATTFGFRGVQFGEWVKQGGKDNDRQGALNAAYDALMDLANIVGVPPKAMSLEGTLGLAIGAQGNGKAAAHFRPDTLVINLTKTQGAGTLAHEWFHALDNYFSRKRGGEKTMADVGNSQQRYRESNYITYKPEPLYVHKVYKNVKGITKAELLRNQERRQNSAYWKNEYWVKDESHPQGVRPEVEERFADLVDALNTSPMKDRARSIDGVKEGTDGYWSRIIELGARSFENYVIHKMQLNGYDNDYLANVVRIENFNRDESRFPYLKDEELTPVAEAFDNLFAEIKTKETDNGNVAMFSQSQAKTANPHTVETLTASLTESLNNERNKLGDAIMSSSAVHVITNAEIPADVANDAKFSLVDRERLNITSKDTPLTTAWKTIAKNDGLFQFKVSDSHDLIEVFEETINSVVDIEESTPNKEGAIQQWNVYPFNEFGRRIPNNHGIVRLYDDGKIEIDVLNWTEGKGGSAVYAAVANFAYNTGNVFAGDRGGIGADGMMRRLENLISSTLKFGTTDHISPHKDMLSNLGFDWKDGDTEYNLDQMLRASAKAVTKGTFIKLKTNEGGVNSVEAIKSSNAVGVDKLNELYYDETDGTFREKSNGKQYTDKQFEALAATSVSRGVDAGSATLKRTVITLTSLSKTGSGEWGRFLGSLVKLSRDNLNQARGIAYSQNEGSIQAFVKDGQVYFVSDNISKDTTNQELVGLVKHEIAEHIMDMAADTDAEYQSIVKAVQTLAKAGNKAAIEAVASVPDSTVEKNKPREALAYLVQTNPSLSVSKRFIAWFKQAIRNFSKTLPSGMKRLQFVTWANSLSTDDIHYMAAQALYGAPAQINSVSGKNGVMFSKIKQETIGNFDANNNDIRFSKGNPQSNLTPDWASPAESKLDSTFPPDETKSQAAQRIIQDKFNRFKVLQDWVKSQGVDLSEQADVYLAETSMTGRTSVRKEDFREDIVQPLVKKTQVSNISMEEIGEFLKAQHAPEANKRAREIQGNADATAYGVSDADAKTAMGEFESLPYFAQLKEIANEWRDITNATKKIKLESGLLTDEMVKAWEETYDVYIPVKGNDEGGAKQGTGKGLNVRDKNKMRLGHGLRDEAIIENILRDHETAITLDEKNRVGKALIKFALEVNNDNIITIDRPVKRKVLKKGETAYVVAYQGLDIASFDTAKEANLYIQAQSALGRTRSDFSIETTQDPVRVMLQASPQLADNEVTVYVAGHAVRLQINDEIAAREYKNMGVEHLNTILSAGREVNNWLSKAYTGYSPDFIFTNPIRDAIQGAITLTGNEGIVMAGKIFANYPLAVKELVKHFKDKKSSDLVNEYRANGGSTGAAYLSDLERIGNDIQASYNEYQGALQTYKSTYETMIDKGRSKKAAHTMALLKAGAAGFKKIPVIGHFLKLMGSLNATTENALRVATYKTLRDNGTSKLKAAAQAKNLMNFNRKGEQSNAAGALYLFFNPSVQGTQLIYEALTNSPHKREAQMLAGSMALTAFTLAMMALNGDDEDKEKWEKTPDYIKDGNIVFNMFGVQFTLTLPYGYRVFWGLGNVMADATQKNADYSKLGIRLASSIFANFSPMGNPMEGQNGVFQVLPTSAKMALAPGVNEDGFGMPITPKKWKESTPDSQLMNRGTVGSFYDGVSSKLNSLTGGSKYEAGLVDVSPETLKFWVRSLTGGAGQFVFDSTDILSSAAQGVAPQDPRNIPIVRRFVRTGGVSDARSAFWEIKNEADIANEQLKSAIKDHDRDAISDLRDRKGILARMANVSDRMLKMANAKRNAAAKIKQDQSLSLKEKQELMMGLEKEEAEIYDRFIRLYSDRISK